MTTPDEVFSAGRLIAKRKAPYFSTALFALVPRLAEGLGTVGVTKDGLILWDPEAVAQWHPEEMAGAWIHEVLHLVFRHQERAERAGLDPALSNIADDLVNNPLITDMGMRLPAGSLFPEMFGFKRGLTAREYYDLLLKRRDPQGGGQGKSKKGPQKGDGKGGGEGQGTPGKSPQGGGGGQGGADSKPDLEASKPKVGGGWCGGCAGRPVPGEPEPGKDKGGRTEAEIQRIGRNVAEAMREHASRSQGSVPGGWLRWAEEALEPPRIPWQTKLARITRNAVAWRAGAVDHRYDAPSRRQAGLGFGAGKPVLPRLRQPVPNVAVAVDTSGSMGTKELVAAVRESRGVLLASGAQIQFLACDCKLHAVETVRDWRQMPKLLKGGGGTSFVPVFERIEKLRPRPEVLIFVTDGMGDAPKHAPQGVQVIWLLVGAGCRPPCDWGHVIHIDDVPSYEDEEDAA